MPCDPHCFDDAWRDGRRFPLVPPRRAATRASLRSSTALRPCGCGPPRPAGLPVRSCRPSRHSSADRRSLRSEIMSRYQHDDRKQARSVGSVLVDQVMIAGMEKAFEPLRRRHRSILLAACRSGATDSDIANRHRRSTAKVHPSDHRASADCTSPSSLSREPTMNSPLILRHRAAAFYAAAPWR